MTTWLEKAVSGACWRGASLDGDKPRRGGRGWGACWRGASLDGDKPRRGGRGWGACWRGASLDGDKPRRGGRDWGTRAGEEHRSTGTSPVVAGGVGVRAGEEHRSTGTSPVVAGGVGCACWRGASLDGDKPRRGGRGWVCVLARSIARRGQAPSWREGLGGACWRGASLEGNTPRRSGRSFPGIIDFHARGPSLAPRAKSIPGSDSPET